MENEVSITFPQELSTSLYLKPHESSTNYSMQQIPS